MAEKSAGTVAEIFAAFLKLGLTSFGGPIAHLGYFRTEFVERRKWLSESSYADIVALCQFLPGPNIVNFSIIYGTRLYGFWGAAFALFGLLAPPVALMIVAGMAYSAYGQFPLFRDGLTGLAAAAAGLLVYTAVQMVEPLVRKERALQFLVALATFGSVGVMQWSMLWTLLVMAPISIGLAWRRRA